MTRVLRNSFITAFFCFPILAAGQTVPTNSATTLRSNTSLVVVDVVVTDSKHNPVHLLTASDFNLLEDGRAQAIKVFEEHSTTEPVNALPSLKLDPGTFTNYSSVPASGALNVLLLDRLNTPMKDQAYVLEEMLKYLKEARPGTRIAIFGLTTQLSLLQGFTSDPELLRSLLTKKGALKGSSLLNNVVDGDNPGQDDPLLDNATGAMSSSEAGQAALIANIQQFEAQQQSFQFQLRARYTLDALNQLARYLGRLPGRKNIIWFSGSFPISILPDPDIQSPFAIVASAEGEFRETANLLARSQVAVYPIDARGLMTAPMLDAGNSGQRYAQNGGTAYAKDSAKFFTQTTNEHGTMEQMADATGGRAFINNNDLKESVQKAIEAGSNYYTLAYAPTNHQWKGEYRKIQVALARQGLTLAYRRGYYADDPSAPLRHDEPKPTKEELAPYNVMRAAMMRGGPSPTQIIFKSNIRPTVADSESAIVPGNKPNEKISGPYRRYTVDFAVDPRDVNFATSSDGAHQCVLEFRTFVYGADDQLVNSQVNGIKASIPASSFSAVLAGNLTYHQQISVPAKGEYFFRIGVYDPSADRAGALELPVAAVAKLPPLPTQNPAPASSPAGK